MIRTEDDLEKKLDIYGLTRRMRLGPNGSYEHKARSVMKGVRPTTLRPREASAARRQPRGAKPRSPIMARPRLPHPTPAELELLKVLWRGGEMSVRDVLEALEPCRQRAYTSVMSLLNVMHEKGLLHRRLQGRAFLYSARLPRAKAVSAMLRDLLGRAFDNSASALVAHLLQQAKPSKEELKEIHALVQSYQQSSKGR